MCLVTQFTLPRQTSDAKQRGIATEGITIHRTGAAGRASLEINVLRRDPVNRFVNVCLVAVPDLPIKVLNVRFWEKLTFGRY